ncbi:LysR family transcriptional regulator [Sinorhizobium fredii]|uniref:LysR family transcriptional regulator n=2 Tax=Rhizobium fredii TaxID=380 RepID=A0A844AEY6_RHIFR|nr:LysR family transcriptional regulator [Sinorhizobium fredii]MQX10682.1 LysR family transcriptional regulator [Sinorhizobium fredii]UTY51530.1 LysR family transcriptional regulator [Sinorhizobium fredii]
MRARPRSGYEFTLCPVHGDENRSARDAFPGAAPGRGNRCSVGIPMNLNAFDLNLLRVFDALIRERSVTRAGDQIGLSQPAVSAALRRLRDLLDDQLFIRRGNDMIPTPRAVELGSPVRDALGKIELALHKRKHFDPGTIQRRFTLLGSDVFSVMMMSALSRCCAEEAPAISLQLVDNAWGNAERLLQEDAVDIALETELDVPEWVSSMHLLSAPYVVVASAKHPGIAAAGIAPREVIPLDLFCQLHHVVRSSSGALNCVVDPALAKVGRKRHVALILPHTLGVAIATAHSLHLATVPRQFAELMATHLGLKIYNAPVPLPTTNISVFWHARHNGDPAHQWLRQKIVRVREEFEAKMRARMDPELSIGCPFDTSEPTKATPVDHDGIAGRLAPGTGPAAPPVLSDAQKIAVEL